MYFAPKAEMLDLELVNVVLTSEEVLECAGDNETAFA